MEGSVGIHLIRVSSSSSCPIFKFGSGCLAV